MPTAGHPGMEGSGWIPGGHVQVEMTMEGVELPAAMQVSCCLYFQPLLDVAVERARHGCMDTN